MHYAIGLVCTVAGDAVEGALIRSDGRDKVESIGGVRAVCDDSLSWGLLEATQNDLPTTEILRLERALTDHYATAIQMLRDAHPAEAAQTAVVGLDGHTLRWAPHEGLTLQIGNPWRLSALSGLPVVSDFRRYDIARGGKGAPLEAMFYWALMAREPRPALMVHFGAVTSVTWLSRQNEIIAGDVGPGLELLEEWVQEVADAPHDRDGRVSSRGVIDERCVDYALASPFFSQPLPRTPSRADFERIDVSGLNPQDGAATICAVIADSVRLAVSQLPERPRLAWVTGPGSRHPLILARLAAVFEEVRNVSARGLDPDTLHAEAFAWLGIRYLKGLPVSTPETTGCDAARCAGAATVWGLSHGET